MPQEFKDTLYYQVVGIYEEAKPDLGEEDIRKRIDLLDMALSFAKKSSDPVFAALEKDIFSILEDLTKAKTVLVERINVLEAYLRYLTSLVAPLTYTEKNVEEAGLAKSYRILDILETQVDSKRQACFDQMLKQKDDSDYYYKYGDAMHPETVLKTEKEILPFVKAYCGRNTICHHKYTPDEWGHFLCMFYTMLEVTYKYINVITRYFIENNFEFRQYITEMIISYEKKYAQNFLYIPLNMHIYENDYYDELSNILESDLDIFKINDLINEKKIRFHDNIAFNKLKLIGYAGIGKTTTMEKMIYDELLVLKNNNFSGVIPVFIELISVTSNSPSYSITALIKQKLNITNDLFLEQLIRKGKISVYIDGINELRIINPSEKRAYLKEVEDFIYKNPQLKVVMNDRDNNELSILNNIPTLIIDGVSKDKITEFILGNSTKGEIVAKKITTKMEENPELYEMLKNAFLLKNIMTIVECNQDIPDNADDLAEVFLNAIVNRERVIKRDYKAPHIMRVLTYIVAMDAKNKPVLEDNILLSYFTLCNMLDDYCNLYKKYDRFDNEEMLELIVKLGILKIVNNNMYTFQSKSYFNYFYYEAINQGLLTLE